MPAKKASPSLVLSAVLVIGTLLLVQTLDNDGGRFVFGLLLGLVVAAVYRQRVRLRQLEEQVRQFDVQPAAKVPTPVPVSAPVPARPQEPPPIAVPAHRLTEEVPPPVVRPPSPPPAPLPPAVPPHPTWLDRGLAAAVAWLRRGNPVARAGIVVLFFGGSFLAKYAADHSMFPLELRMAALGAGALVLLGAGWRLRQRQPVYAQTLQGGGIAGFYLTVFAATRLYHLLPQPAALGLLVVVALSAAVLAVLQNALALAVIGTSGGFLAPVLLSTGGGSLAALFTYYTILNVGVFAVAWFRAWRVLNLVGFVFTFGVAGLFRATVYTAQQQATMEFFLWLFFLLYAAVSVLFSLRQKPDLKGYVSSSLVFGLPLAVFTLHTSIIGHAGFSLALSALGLALFYLALAAVLYRTRDDNLRLLAEAFAALGVIFGTLAVPLGFDQHATAIAWAVEGAGLVWLGVRQQRRLARAFGLLIQLASGLAYLAHRDAMHPTQPLLNGLYIGSLSLALAGAASGWWLFRNRERQAPYEQHLDSFAGVWGVLWWLGGGLQEIGLYSGAHGLGARLGFAALSLTMFGELGRRRSWPLLRYIAVLLLPLAVAARLYEILDIGYHHPLAAGAWLGWPLLLAAGWWLLWQLDRTPEPGIQPVLPALHAGIVWLLALLLAWESSWQIHQQIGGVWHELPWGLVPAVMLALLGRHSLAPRWPLQAHENAYRMLAAVPLSLFGALWTLAINLGSDGNPLELPYLPLLNPLDLSVMLLFAAQARHWLSLDPLQRQRLTPAEPHILPGAAAALVFLWLNASLVRALHYLMGTPLDLEGIAHSITVQAAISIFWAVLGFAAMTLATRRAQRVMWLAGAGLMAVLLLKLFLVDTAGRGTLARIASFLIVGTLLLVIGYVSPLPPHKPAANRADTDTGAST
jgi:uncharacterized membrane protein